MNDSTRGPGDGRNGHAGFTAADLEPYIVKDPDALAKNFARALENLGKAASEWLGPRERGEVQPGMADPVTDMVKTFSKVGEYWLAEPHRAMEAQTNLLSAYFDVWSRSMQRMNGEAAPTEDPSFAKEKRFNDPDWVRNPFFDFLRQTYLVTSKWADTLVTGAEGLDEHTRHKAGFYMKQITAALSPANFVATNPELYRQTVASSGANLVEGMRMLAEDIAAGGGQVRLRQTDASLFEIGVNVASTPGKVIAESELCQVIQYEPATDTVLKRPLLICPPWINKFYILDLNPQKSFIKWCVEQGHTVFVISWVNPDARHAMKGWDDYIRDGIDFALDTVTKATGEKQVNAIGYCVGGTLMATTLALHAARKDKRIRSVTFFATQVDFTHAGDLKVFVDEEQLTALEERMRTIGYLPASTMATAFNMLRASELIWPYFVNNYLKGQEPMAFDLLFWNSDSTRVTAANHTFYVGSWYLENRLSRKLMQLGGHLLSLADIKIPVYSLATREDHIAPARSVFIGAGLFGGPVEFVLSGSGHIAGVVNPPDKNKYQFWTGPSVKGSYDDWLAEAVETAGSWWPHWQAWIEKQDGRRVPARTPGERGVSPIEDAPGSYVRVKA